MFLHTLGPHISYFCHTLPHGNPYRNIPWPEEELSIEIGLLNGVHVCDNDVTSFPTAQANHGKILEKFTAKGPSSNLRTEMAMEGQGTEKKGTRVVPLH